MAKMRRKGDLPQKTCVQCGLPFAWRKKWAKVWDEVRYCSDRCRSAARAGGKQKEATPATDDERDRGAGVCRQTNNT
ncbi:MAG: DUF2256 domain-containing protein [Rhodobacteraceae bacterium]|nr:MAG: DUF2256 domain-containing protein [Paracoccaceae bacterium]